MNRRYLKARAKKTLSEMIEGCPTMYATAFEVRVKTLYPYMGILNTGVTIYQSAGGANYTTDKDEYTFIFQTFFSLN